MRSPIPQLPGVSHLAKKRLSTVSPSARGDSPRERFVVVRATSTTCPRHGGNEGSSTMGRRSPEQARGCGARARRSCYYCYAAGLSSVRGPCPPAVAACPLPWPRCPPSRNRDVLAEGGRPSPPVWIGGDTCLALRGDPSTSRPSPRLEDELTRQTWTYSMPDRIDPALRETEKVL